MTSHVKGLHRVWNSELVMAIHVHGGMNEASSLDCSKFCLSTLQLPKSSRLCQETIGEVVWIPKFCAIGKCFRSRLKTFSLQG
jgi:hypothetical protein